MRKIILEYTNGATVDADYYGMVDIHAPILLISNDEELSDEQLISEYAKTINIDYVYETLEQLKEMYTNNPSKELKTLHQQLKEASDKLQKIHKSKKSLLELGLDTSQLTKVSNELNATIQEYKRKIKELEKLEDEFEKVLYEKESILINEYRDSDFYGLTGTVDVEKFIESGKELNVKNLVLNKYQLNFVRFLIDRGWEYIDLSKPLNKVLEGNCVTLEDMYEDFNKEL